jgi:hypothetical protein
VIHLAFKHDIAFSGDFQGAADADRRAIEALGEALAGSDRPFVIASGTLGLAPGHVATARLFRLALESAPAGATLHAVADEGVPIRAIAEVIGRHLDIPAASVAADDAGEHFGWLGGFLAADSPASSALTRELTGWEPAQPGLIEDLDQGHYFTIPSA